MIETNGAVPAAASDDLSEPASPAFDVTRPRLVEPVSIMLDRERHLSLPFWAMLHFERESGLSSLDPDIWNGEPKLAAILALLHSALLEEDPNLTRDQLERLPGATLPNVPYIRDRLGRCWIESMPPPDPKGNGADPKPQPRRTGSS